jgi:peptide/nickel transport system substrate-binding protein
MKNRIPGILLLLIIFSSCTPGSGVQERSSQTLVVGLEGSPITLDPRLARDAYSTRIIPLLFHGLVMQGERAEILPDLAETWEVEHDRIYTFHLKKGIRFAHGRDLDAGDVKYTITSLADPELKSPYQDLVRRIKEITILGPYTIRFELERPHAPFLSQLTLGIVPRDRAEELDREFGRRPAGSGPYRVLRFEAGGEIELAVNPCYSGQAPNIPRIIFRVIPDDVTRIMALERGEVQILQNSVPADDLPVLAKNPQIAITTRPGINYTYLGFNLEDPILKSRKVREAIACAIPRDDLINCLLRGQAQPATGLLAPSHWAYEPEVETYNYDPERARALLDEAGLVDPDGPGPEPRFHLLYKTSQNKFRRWMAEAIAYELSRVGIEVEVRSYEFGTLFADIQAGRFQIYTLTWVGMTEPDMYYTIFHSKSRPPHGANRGGYVNPDVDRLTEQGRILMDQEKRREVYAGVQRILAHDLPYVSLWYSRDVVACDPRLKDFRLFPGGDWRSLATAYFREE